MKKQLYAIALGLILFLAVQSTKASDNNYGGRDYPSLANQATQATEADQPDEPLPEVTPTPPLPMPTPEEPPVVPVKPIKEWTFMTFLNGHNNLDPFGFTNMKQMEEIGSNDQLNIVVQWASLKNKSTKRLYVEKGKSKVLQEFSKPIDMGDYKELLNFIKWTVENYPAKKYFINVWNHGNGWYKIEGLKPTDISWDDNTGHFIKTEELGLVMDEASKLIGHKVDIYGSDACLMAMVEVATQMQNGVQYFLGSEETEPGAGWPYHKFLARWAANPFAEAAEISSYLTEEYYKAYTGGVYGKSEVTFSALNLDALPRMNASLKQLSLNLLSLPSSSLSSIKKLMYSVQGFYNSDYKDLGDFLNKIKNISGVDRNALTDVQANLELLVLINKSTPGKFANASGASIWLPSSSYYWNASSRGKRYLGLQFQEETQWGDFLQQLIK